MSHFQSSKLYDGFSTCFRQWRATETHCKYLHGYGVSFRVWFQGQLDQRNWVFDFGGMKRATAKIDDKTPNEYFSWLLDHTTIIALDDPELPAFQELDARGLIQLRVLPYTGAEMFAEYLFQKIDQFLIEETAGRVRVNKLEFYEHAKNSAIYLR